MHTEGVEEGLQDAGVETWLVRSECCGCGLSVGVEASPDQAVTLVDRLLWTDDAHSVLERMPPYVEPLVKQEVEAYARSAGMRVITYAFLSEARRGEPVAWDAEAEARLTNVPAPVRAMARLELERTAVERGQPRVTVALMEEVKARYFGLAQNERGRPG
ncbi:MAG: PCP reductase family protein [Nitrospiraceae bacterium]